MQILYNKLYFIFNIFTKFPNLYKMKLFNSKAILLALLLTSTLSFSQSNSTNQTLFGHQLTAANIKSIDHSGVIR